MDRRIRDANRTSLEEQQLHLVHHRHRPLFARPLTRLVEGIRREEGVPKRLMKLDPTTSQADVANTNTTPSFSHFSSSSVIRTLVRGVLLSNSP